jgi:alkylation response protein AidB-like acyl-CoA dehydrogenase
MDHEIAVSKAKEIADRVLAPAAGPNDKAARFSTEAVDALSKAGLLGLLLPTAIGGSALGLRTLAAVISTLAEADGSVAMIYLMHLCGAATIAAAPAGADVADSLGEIAAGRHLSTLAFSEAGSRSHFWAPVSRARANGAGVHISAKKSWVTSAGHAQSYVVGAGRRGGHRFDALSHSGRIARAFRGGALGWDGTAIKRLGAHDARGLRSSVRTPAYRGQRWFPCNA